jgi:hypothetical protein
MHERLPSASSTTQYAGAATSLTRRPPSVEDSLEPMLGFVLRDPHVEVPTLLELLLGKRQRLIAVMRVLPPYSRHLPVVVYGFPSHDVCAEQRCVERCQIFHMDGVESQLQLSQARDVGLDPKFCSAGANASCQVKVATGYAVHIVARQRDDHIGVGERDVGMVVGRLRGLTDGVDQCQAGNEVAGAKPGFDPAEDLSPVIDAGLAHLLCGQCRRSSFNAGAPFGLVAATTAKVALPRRPAPIVQLRWA